MAEEHVMLDKNPATLDQTVLSVLTRARGFEQRQARMLPDDGQAGSYQLFRRISTDKRASWKLPLQLKQLRVNAYVCTAS